MNTKEEIIEFLILNQSYIKHEVEQFKRFKAHLKATEMHVFHQDIDDQYDARIKQWISMYVGDRLAIPIEDVIILLERIDIDEFLSI